ncbi:MAG: ribosome recycling factor [Bacteroidota bacterium]
MAEETIESYLAKGRNQMDEAIDRLNRELAKIRAGKASPDMLSGIMVDYYGTPTPLNQVGNVNATDSRTIAIQPWEKKMLGPIEQAIFSANLGITPMNDGEFVRLTVPPLTEERRKLLVKQSKSLGEDAKVSLRTVRHKLIDFIKKEVKEGYPEDAGKRKEEEVQKMVKNHENKVADLLDAKEKDIMTI